MKWKLQIIPLYDVEVFLCVEKDPKIVDKKITDLGFYMREKDRRELFDNNLGITIPLYKDYLRSYLLWMPELSNSSEDMSVLVHELVHVKNYIFQHIGLENGIPSKLDEVESYLMGYLMETTLIFFQKKK